MRRLLLISLLVLLPVAFYGLGHHFVANHNALTLGRGGQTWAVANYDDRWVYFANRNGVYQYDGRDWERFNLSNGLEARSVAAAPEEGRVYVAGINEFGYLSPDRQGKMHYHCLSDSMATADLGNIWGLHLGEHGTMFLQGDRGVLVVDRQAMTSRFIPSDVPLCCSNLVGQILYLGTDHGVRMLIGGNIRRAFGTGRLDGERIRAMLPRADGTIVIVTATGGIYTYDNNSIAPLGTSHWAEICRSEIFAAALHGDLLALGTIRDGLLLLDLSTDRLQHYNRDSGMQDDTVLSMAFDNAGDLWTGLDNGIDKIFLTVPITTISSRNNPIGSGYVALGSAAGDKLYLGTNRGLYTVDLGALDKTPVALPSLTGQVWGLRQMNGKMLCMHDRGLYTLPSTASPIMYGGAWTMVPVPGRTDAAYVGTYNGICVVQNDASGGLRVVADHSSLGESVYNLVADAAGALWFPKNNHGVERLVIDPKTFAIVSRREYGLQQGLPTLRNIHISRVSGNVIVATPTGAFRYDAATDRFVEDTELNTRLGKSHYYRQISEYGQYIFALTPQEVTRVFAKGDRHAVTLPILPKDAEPLHPGDKFSVINDSTLILPTPAGFSVYDFGKANNPAQGVVRQYARINSMTLTARGDSLVYRCNPQGLRDIPAIDYDDNSVKFRYGFDTSGTYASSYSYRLNDEPWSEPTHATSKEYTNLPEGDYTFEVRALLLDGTEQTDSISFTILPPWYRSTAAKVSYFLLLLLAMYVAYRMLDSRVHARERRVARVKDHEIEEQRKQYRTLEHLKDQQISQLEHDMLRSQLEHKSHEITNLLMSVSGKNQALIDIKEELRRITAALRNSPDAATRTSLVALQARIDSAIQTDKILERIEKEFDLVHNSFMARLRAEYPDITNNELLMCAYITMNLSTKEIAPLMNLSVRGVETMRYRLRKKFGLERSDSLTAFLANGASTRAGEE